MLDIKQQYTILIVDDDESLNALMQRRLQDQGYSTIPAYSSQKALEVLQRNSIDLMVLDYLLPGMTGKELVEQLLLEQHKNIPFIFVTGQGDERIAVDMMKRGALDYLIKDTSLPALLPSVVEQCITQIENKKRLILVEQQLKDYAHQIQERNELLELSNKELDDFCYIVSHDLKEPLRGIRSYTSILKNSYQDKLDEPGISKLDTLTHLTDRLEQMIKALLQYSRVGRSQLQLSHTNMNELVEETIEPIKAAYQNENIEIHIPRPLPQLICDRIQMSALYQNLITNAIKYNENDQKQIQIGYYNDRNELPAPVPDTDILISQECPAFFVSDNGIGIPEKHTEAIFRVFKRLHGRNKYGGGTGAGLTIVKKIVERHQGRIWVDSTRNQGTTFYFTINGVADPHD